MRVLIIEDDDSLRAMLVRDLARLGHEVRGAANGLEGLQLSLRESFDLILTDVRMPGCDGIEFMKLLRLRTDSKGARAPRAIFITGCGDLEADELRALGAEAVLRKPFERDELHGWIARIEKEKEDWRQANPPLYGITG